MSGQNIEEQEGLVMWAVGIFDAMYIENMQLKKRINELEECCQNFIEVEKNLHKRIAELSKNDK